MRGHVSVALALDRRTPGTRQRPGHTAAVLEVDVGGVDDCVHLLAGQVAGNDRHLRVAGRPLPGAVHGCFPVRVVLLSVGAFAATAETDRPHGGRFAARQGSSHVEPGALA